MYNLMTFGIPRHVMPINIENGELDVTDHLRWLEMLEAREQQERQQQVREQEDSCAIPVKSDSGAKNDNNGIHIAGHGLVTPQSTPSSSIIDKHSNHGRLNIVQEDDSEIAVLGPMDILVGRGTSSRSSPGYIRMRNLIHEQYEQYENAAGRNCKTQITKNILVELQNAGCRFVRNKPNNQGLMVCNEAESREKIAHAFRNMRRTSAKPKNQKVVGSGCSQNVVHGSKRARD